MNNLPTPPLQTDNKNSLPLIIFGIILALGLIAAAFVLGTQFKNLKQSGDYRQRLGGSPLQSQSCPNPNGRQRLGTRLCRCISQW